MNLRINSLNNQRTKAPSSSNSQAYSDTQSTKEQLARVANSLRQEQANSRAVQAMKFSPQDQLMAVAEKTYKMEQTLQGLESKLQATQDPTQQNNLNKLLQQSQGLFDFFIEREEFWSSENQLAMPPQGSLEHKQVQTLRAGIAQIEANTEKSLRTGNPKAKFDKHKLDVVSSYLSNGRLEEAMKFLSINAEDLGSITPLVSQPATVISPEQQATIAQGKIEYYKQASYSSSETPSGQSNKKDLAGFFTKRAEYWTQQQSRAELPPNDPRQDKLEMINLFMTQAESRYEGIANNPNASKKEKLQMKTIERNLSQWASLLGSPRGLNNDPKIIDLVYQQAKKAS